jgi:anti-anti-sigma factor
MSSRVTLAANAGPSTDSHYIKLDGSLDIRDAGELRSKILDALQSHPATVVDAGNVESVDTSIVQILVASVKSAERLGRSLTISTGDGAAVPDTLQRLGFSTNPA